MSFIDITTSFNGDEAARSFTTFGLDMDRRVVNAVRQTAEWAKTEIADNAPVRTGNLRDSIGVGPMEKTDGGVYCDVGTGEPYGRRIEFGYDETDTLDRSYHQAPQPYFGPVVPQILGELEGRIRR